MRWDCIETDYGKFYIKEVYIYYDGPKLFLCADASERNFLAVAVDEDDICEKWLYTPISNNRLFLLKNQNITLRTAFAKPESGWLFRIQTYFSGNMATLSLINSRDLLPEELPEEDIFLEADSFDNSLTYNDYCENTAIFATQQLLNAIDFHIQPPRNIPKGKIKMDLLGQILSHFQSLLYSTIYKGKGRLPKYIKENAALYVNALQPGSFQIRAQQINSENLFQDQMISEGMQICFELISSTNDKNNLIQTANNYKLGVLAKYQQFLKSLAIGNYGLLVEWSSPTGTCNRQALDSQQIQAIVSALEEEDSYKTRNITTQGYLTMINVNNKQFILTALDKVEYRGTVSNKLRGIVFEVPWDSKSKLVEVTMEETVDVFVATEKEKYSYYLIAIKYI